MPFRPGWSYGARNPPTTRYITDMQGWDPALGDPQAAIDDILQQGEATIQGWLQGQRQNLALGVEQVHRSHLVVSPQLEAQFDSVNGTETVTLTVRPAGSAPETPPTPTQTINFIPSWVPPPPAVVVTTHSGQQVIAFSPDKWKVSPTAVAAERALFSGAQSFYPASDFEPQWKTYYVGDSALLDAHGDIVRNLVFNGNPVTQVTSGNGMIAGFGVGPGGGEGGANCIVTSNDGVGFTVAATSVGDAIGINHSPNGDNTRYDFAAAELAFAPAWGLFVLAVSPTNWLAQPGETLSRVYRVFSNGVIVEWDYLLGEELAPVFGSWTAFAISTTSYHGWPGPVTIYTSPDCRTWTHRYTFALPAGQPAAAAGANLGGYTYTGSYVDEGFLTPIDSGTFSIPFGANMFDTYPPPPPADFSGPNAFTGRSISSATYSLDAFSLPTIPAGDEPAGIDIYTFPTSPTPPPGLYPPGALTVTVIADMLGP